MMPFYQKILSGPSKELLWGKNYVKSYVKGRMLSKTPYVKKSYVFRVTLVIDGHSWKSNYHVLVIINNP